MLCLSEARGIGHRESRSTCQARLARLLCNGTILAGCRIIDRYVH